MLIDLILKGSPGTDDEQDIANPPLLYARYRSQSFYAATTTPRRAPAPSFKGLPDRVSGYTPPRDHHFWIFRSDSCPGSRPAGDAHVVACRERVLICPCPEAPARHRLTSGLLSAFGGPT